MFRAHPRWRGADSVPDMRPGWLMGSSPPARGRRRLRLRPSDPRGLIPAGAGQTPDAACPPRACRAHPRWRGADPWIGAASPYDVGSSPLARGRQRPQPSSVREHGLIPAGAGQTLSRTPPQARAWAHPRWRGADDGVEALQDLGQGSSPLARGRPPAMRTGRILVGLIPAGAGQT